MVDGIKKRQFFFTMPQMIIVSRHMKDKTDILNPAAPNETK